MSAFFLVLLSQTAIRQWIILIKLQSRNNIIITPGVAGADLQTASSFIQSWFVEIYYSGL